MYATSQKGLQGGSDLCYTMRRADPWIGVRVIAGEQSAGYRRLHDLAKLGVRGTWFVTPWAV